MLTVASYSNLEKFRYNCAMLDVCIGVNDIQPSCEQGTGGALPYMALTKMCDPIRYGFQRVLS